MPSHIPAPFEFVNGDTVCQCGDEQDTDKHGTIYALNDHERTARIAWRNGTSSELSYETITLITARYR